MTSHDHHQVATPRAELFLHTGTAIEHPNHYSAYNIILRAEQYAVQEREEGDIISARVAGFLLLEHHVQSTIMSDAACASLVSRIASPH